MIMQADKLETTDVINFGTIRDKRLGKVTLVASLNPQMKTIEGKCIRTGESLVINEVNKQPICCFDESYVKHYLSI
jgi:hypothetical protein